MLKLLNIPAEIMPLAILRPISGSASMGIATNIMQENGGDSKIGLTASTIMGATETTLYNSFIYEFYWSKKNKIYIGFITNSKFCGCSYSYSNI